MQSEFCVSLYSLHVILLILTDHITCTLLMIMSFFIFIFASLFFLFFDFLFFFFFFFFFSSRRRHTRLTCDWSSDVCSSDLRRKSPSRDQGAGASDCSRARRRSGSCFRAPDVSVQGRGFARGGTIRPSPWGRRRSFGARPARLVVRAVARRCRRSLVGTACRAHRRGTRSHFRGRRLPTFPSQPDRWRSGPPTLSAPPSPLHLGAARSKTPAA